MKTIHHKTGSGLFMIMLIALTGFMSCKRHEDDLALTRMFMPSGDIKITTTDTVATITWDAALYTKGQAVTYTVELSGDTLFQTKEQTFTTDTSGIVITGQYLTVRKKYYVRIRTNGKDSTTNSKWLTSNGFSITGEQLFLPLPGTDIIDKAVILKWKSTPGLTKIVLSTPGAPPVEVPLTEEESTNGEKLVEQLTPSTQYTVEIFDGSGKSKGILVFSTKASPAGGELVVDLTGITGNPSILEDTLPKLAAGSIVILKRAETYNISSEVNLSRSVTMISENSFNPVLPLIYFSSNLNITAGSIIDSVVFRNVVIRGSDYASKYVMNINKVGTIGKISFESCFIEIFRGVVRLQTSATGGTQVNDFSITDCVIDSISNYGIVNVDNAACAVQDITISNSTIYKAEKVVTSKQNSNAVIITDCTVNEAPQGGGSSYLIDYNSVNVTAGIKLKNCIVGTGRSNAGNTSVRGARAGATTVIEASNTYNTSDYVVSNNAIPGLIPYNGASAALFLDPAKGNFTIKDNGFAGKSSAGDPRWRQ